MASENPKIRNSSGGWQVHVGWSHRNYADIVGVDVSVWARPASDSNPRCFFYDAEGDRSSQKNVKVVHPYFASTFQTDSWRFLCDFLVAQSKMEAGLLNRMEAVNNALEVERAKIKRRKQKKDKKTASKQKMKAGKEKNR